MEPPPRIFHYDGFFTQYRSLDIPLKIFSTLFCFIVLLLTAAFAITRKTYKRVPKDDSLILPSVAELCRNGAFQVQKRLPGRQDCLMRRGRFRSRDILVIEDWKLINLFIHSKVLDHHFSCAPKIFRRKWHGLMMSDDTLEHRPEMRQIILHAFATLPSKLYCHTGDRVTEHAVVQACLTAKSSLDKEKLDLWIWTIITDLFFFGPPTSQSDIEMHKNSFTQYLIECITSLQLLHTSEVSSSNFLLSILKTRSRNSNAMKLLNNLNDLINPLIHYYLEQFIDSTLNDVTVESSCRPIRTHPIESKFGYDTNLLLQLIQSHHFLKEEGSPIEFLTLTHVIHVLAESCLITHYSVGWILRTLFTVLASRPDWQLRLQNEAKEVLDGNAHCTATKNGFVSEKLVSHCLSLKHVECLVWTKALVNEAIRFCVPGWPLGSVRQALRDGTIDEYDFAEDDLVLFNLPSYYFDPELWESFQASQTSKMDQPNSSGLFSPHRFLDDSTSHDQLSLPMHWFRTIMSDFTVCVPNKFVYLLTTSVLLHLFGRGWTVSLEDEEEGSLIMDENKDGNNHNKSNFFEFPSVLPNIRFQSK